MATLLLSYTNMKDPTPPQEPVTKGSFSDDMVKLIESDIISVVIYRQGRSSTLIKSNGELNSEVWCE